MPDPGPNLTPRETLELLLGHLGFVFEIEETQSDDHVVLNIRTRDPGRLVGREGRTLDDLQYLLNRMMDRGEEGASRVIVDVEGHRQKEQLDFLAAVRERAERVRSTGAPETLPPMNAYERWKRELEPGEIEEAGYASGLADAAVLLGYNLAALTREYNESRK